MHLKDEGLYWTAKSIENQVNQSTEKAQLIYHNDLGITNNKQLREYLRGKGFKVKNVVEGLDGRASLLVVKQA